MDTGAEGRYAEGSTRWTIIRDAALGDEAARAWFAHHYAPVVRAYLGARWRGSAWIEGLDDAMQDVFVECFREDGILARAKPDRGAGFRAFLLGAVRNVARRFERNRLRDRLHPAGPSTLEAALPADDDVPSRVFDRAWARTVMRDAANVMQQRAHREGAEAVRRVELLRLRFQEGLPIREIADRWGADATKVHREYARARREFQWALREVVAGKEGGSSGPVVAECRRLLALLG